MFGLFNAVNWKAISLKKVTLHGILGAITAYGMAKAGGADNFGAALAAIASALSSMGALTQDPTRPPLTARFPPPQDLD